MGDFSPMRNVICRPGKISVPSSNTPVKFVDVLKRLFKQALLHKNFRVCTL